MTTAREGSPTTISSADRAIKGSSPRQRFLKEPDTSTPDILVSRVNKKLSELIEAGADVLVTAEGMMATLEAPVSVFSYPRVPRELRDIAEENAQDRMRVRILSRGYGTDYAYVDPLVAIDFTVSPNIRREAPIRISVSQSATETPMITVRRKSTTPHKGIPYDPYILGFFLRTVERAKKNWGGIEDYIADLRELARGKMSPEAFAELKDSLRFSDEKLAGQKRVSGEPAIEHSYRAVRDAMLAGVFNPIDLSTIGLHDNWEDAPDLQQVGLYSVWYKKTKADITARFGKEKARRLMALTKPRPDPEGTPLEDREIETQEEGDEMAIRSMLAIPEAGFDKIFDKTDNVETLDAMPAENQIKTLHETIALTKRVFMHEKVKAVNPRAWRIAMKRLITAMEPLCGYHRIEIPPDILALK